MGTSKACLDLSGRTLLQRVLDAVAPCIAEVVVVAAAGQSLPPIAVPVVYDQVPDSGPVGGIHAGLQAVRHDVAFAVACDTPFLQPALIRLLVERAQGGAIVVPTWAGRRQPLPAVYPTSLIPELERRLRAGRLRLGELGELPGARVVPEEEVRRADPDGLSFRNVNTPEAYAAAQELLRREV